MGRALESRINQWRRTDAIREKRKLESAEATEQRLQSARQYKKTRRSLQVRLDELEAAASDHRFSQATLTEERNKSNQGITIQSLKLNSDEDRFFTEIDKPLSKVCASCGELAAIDTVKTLEYSSLDARFLLLSVANSKGTDRGLIEAGVARHGSREMVTFCFRCYQSLAKKQVPRFSLASVFKITPVPGCLTMLNPMEARMIGIGVCFTTCFTLGALGQSATRGNSINFWNSAYDTVTRLPRPASRCGVIRMKVAGSSASSPYYSVRPWLLREALAWLIANNPIYQNIHIDYELLDTMPSEPDIPAVDFEEDDVEIDNVARDDNNSNDLTHNEQFDESFVLEHATETQKETDIILELLRGQQEDRAYVASRPDRPMNEYTTKLLMQSCFPTLFPHGLGGFHAVEGAESRVHDFKLADYCNHLMSFHDRRFVMHPTFKFFCLNLIQRRQIDGLLKQVDHIFDRSGETAVVADEVATGNTQQPQQTQQRQHNVSRYLKDLRPFFRSVRGTGLYWANVRDDVMAMIGDPALDTPWPTFFVTLSAADTYWPDFFRVCDPSLSLDEAAALSPSKRRQLLNDNPDLAARHFHRRFQAFFKHIMCQVKANG